MVYTRTLDQCLLRPMSDCQLCCECVAVWLCECCCVVVCVCVAVLLCVCCSVVAMWLYVGGRMLVKVVMRVLSGLH